MYQIVNRKLFFNAFFFSNYDKLTAIEMGLVRPYLLCCSCFYDHPFKTPCGPFIHDTLEDV